jgi:hypothetical protein
MVFGFRSSPATTPEQEDPKGTKKYHFSFDTHTRGELQQLVEQLMIDYQHSPLAGAKKVMDMFEDERDAKILEESPTIQTVVLGTGNHTGPVTYFLGKAAEQLEMPSARHEDQVLFDNLTARYAAMLERVETAKVLLEDPEGKKKYRFSFGTMTGSDLQGIIEDTTTQFDKAGMHARGAQKLLDMFNSPQDRALLVESANIRHRVLGGADGKGPIDFMLDRAEEHMGHGEGNHADNILLEQQNARYERLRSDTFGKKPQIKQPAGSHMLGVYQGNQSPDGASR